MIKINIPGYKNLEIENVVFDYNGTIADDGILIKEVEKFIYDLVKEGIRIYILTADTNGSVRQQCGHLPVKIEVFEEENATEYKKKAIERIGADNTVSIGNGRNDMKMFKTSILSIGVVGKEGSYLKSLLEADIITKSIIDAIELLLNPHRLKATLRS